MTTMTLQRAGSYVSRTALGIIQLGLVSSIQTANAQSTFVVPDNFASIAAAVAGASAGDTIRVRSGRWCGAQITKRLDLIGEGGATIIACTSNPGPALN